MKIIQRALVFLVLAGLLTSLAGCNAPKVEAANADEVKVYADPAAEKIFGGISVKNYGGFSEDFDQ